MECDQKSNEKYLELLKDIKEEQPSADDITKLCLLYEEAMKAKDETIDHLLTTISRLQDVVIPKAKEQAVLAVIDYFFQNPERLDQFKPAKKRGRKREYGSGLSAWLSGLKIRPRKKQPGRPKSAPDSTDIEALMKKLIGYMTVNRIPMRRRRGALEDMLREEQSQMLDMKSRRQSAVKQKADKKAGYWYQKFRKHAQLWDRCLRTCSETIE